MSLAFAAHALAQDAATTTATQATTPVAEPSPDSPWGSFADPQDGAFDASSFLDSATGFLPIVVPVTEPAVGYGLAGGLVFFEQSPRVVQTPAGLRVIPPNTTAVIGMGTENGSWAVGGGHLHTWRGGRIRYVVGGGYGSLNLDWFGQGDAFGGQSFAYNIDAAVVIQKLTFKLGESDFFVGPTQRLVATRSVFDFPHSNLGIPPAEFDSTTSGLGVNLSYDTRNSLFALTRGTKASLSYSQQSEALGGDFDYGRFDGEVCQYLPLGGPFTLGLRGTLGMVGDNAPFYDLAAVSLRGVQAGRYVDDVAMAVEAELRWDLTQRWSLVGFGGLGWVADDLNDLDEASSVWSSGSGFRYLLARRYDLRMGLDAATSEDADWSIYVTVGTGWLRD